MKDAFLYHWKGWNKLEKWTVVVALFGAIVAVVGWLRVLWVG